MKKDTITKAKKYAWQWMSRYIRLRDAIPGKYDMEGRKIAPCCSCGKEYKISGKGCMQAGHYVAGRCNAVLYEEENCHAQCYFCNIRLAGNTINYKDFMHKKYGQERTEEIEQLRHVNKQMAPHEHREMGDYFKDKVNELGGWE